MRYLSHEEVLIIHAKIIDGTGGAHGVRDMHLLASIAERPKMQFGGRDLYPFVFDKAAAYFESTAFHHVFVDGNKRTAIAIATRFLFLNEYDVDVLNDELEHFVLDAVVKKYDLKMIAAWFKIHSRKREKSKR